MFIKLYVSPNVFRMFRIEDIVSIEPCFYADDAFEKYLVYLSGQEEPIDLTWRQGTQLAPCLQYHTIYNDPAGKMLFAGDPAENPPTEESTDRGAE